MQKFLANLGKYTMPLVFITGFSFLAIRAILNSRFATTNLLYLVIPFIISVLLYFFTKPLKSASVWATFVNHVRGATIVFFLTSAFLMEGFLCVLMFMPIYYFMVIVAFLFALLVEVGSKFRAMSLPVIVLVLSVEGLTPQTTFPRQNLATYVVETPQDIDTLKQNMAAEISMPKQRGWFLRLFPLPDKIKAGTLGEGDVHNLHFTYKKWGFGNFSRGEMDILISQVSDNHIQTRITKNTAYLSHYMNIEGTEVHFTPLENGNTQVSLTVKYERLLDPFWYFGPMQKLAAKQSAKYLVDTIITKEAFHG